MRLECYYWEARMVEEEYCRRTYKEDEEAVIEGLSGLKQIVGMGKLRHPAPGWIDRCVLIFKMPPADLHIIEIIPKFTHHNPIVFTFKSTDAPIFVGEPIPKKWISGDHAILIPVGDDLQ